MGGVLGDHQGSGERIANIQEMQGSVITGKYNRLHFITAFYVNIQGEIGLTDRTSLIAQIIIMFYP